MSVSAQIIAFDTRGIPPRAVDATLDHYRTAERQFDEDAPSWLDYPIGVTTRLQKWYNALEPPPKVNDADLWDYLQGVEWFQTPVRPSPVSCKVSFDGASAAILGGGLFREFIQSRTERGHRLWSKFTGFGFERLTGREWIPLCIDDTDYRIETQSLESAGFLQGAELLALANELELVGSELAAFYADLDERYRRCDAVQGHAIELICYLCRIHSLYNPRSKMLAYRMI